MPLDPSQQIIVTSGGSLRAGDSVKPYPRGRCFFVARWEGFAMVRRLVAAFIVPLLLLSAIGCGGSAPESPKVKDGGPTIKPVTPSAGGKPGEPTSPTKTD